MKSQQGAGYNIRPLHLKDQTAARQVLERIGVDPGGISQMLPKLQHHTLLLNQVRAAAANIIKQEMLSIGGDAAVTRGTVSCAVSHTDLLLMGTRKQLTRLCSKLVGQPFGLKALSVQLTDFLQSSATTQQQWQIKNQTLQLKRPLIMGILNITPDSFSDGGRFATHQQAVERAYQMESEGADLIDIGGESTRPGSDAITVEEELGRVLPVIEALSGKLKVPISIDTWKSQVAEQCLQAGAEIINDISGLTFDPDLAKVAAEHRAGLVLMHTRGTPQNMQLDTYYRDIMGEVSNRLLSSASKAEQAGVYRGQIVLDPGIGFAKDLAGNLELLRRLPELAALGYPLLLGTSRKSFIGKLLDRPSTDDRLFGTAASVALGVANGAKILRVHDVAAMKDVAMVAHGIVNQQSDTEGDQ